MKRRKRNSWLHLIFLLTRFERLARWWYDVWYDSSSYISLQIILCCLLFLICTYFFFTVQNSLNPGQNKRKTRLKDMRNVFSDLDWTEWVKLDFFSSSQGRRRRKERSLSLSIMVMKMTRCDSKRMFPLILFSRLLSTSLLVSAYDSNGLYL